MENKNIYKFLGKEYNNLLDYAEALSQSYPDGLNFIYQPEFLEQFTDSYLKGRIVAEQKRSYYATSAFAAIIYLLNPELGLAVNGRYLKDYDDIADALDDPDNREIVIHLFKDHTISHTIALANQEQPEIFDIENNIDDPAVVMYYQMYYDYLRYPEKDAHGYKALDFYLMLCLDKEDPFVAYEQLLKSAEFKAALAHRFGLKEVLEAYNKSDYQYYILNSFMNDAISISIAQIAEAGNHSYIFLTPKYFNNYKLKGCAKKIKKIHQKVIQKYADSSSIEITDNKLYYDLYKYVIRAYDLGLLKAKDDIYKFDSIYKEFRVNKDYLNNITYKGEVEEAEVLVLPKKELKYAIKALKLELKHFYKVELNKKLGKME